MDEKMMKTIKNVVTLGGAIAMAVALLDGIENVDDIQQITSGKQIPQLTDGKSHDEPKEEPEKSHDDKLADLKRQLAELEGESGKEES